MSTVYGLGLRKFRVWGFRVEGFEDLGPMGFRAVGFHWGFGGFKFKA